MAFRKQSRAPGRFGRAACETSQPFFTDTHVRFITEEPKDIKKSSADATWKSELALFIGAEPELQQLTNFCEKLGCRKRAYISLGLDGYMGEFCCCRFSKTVSRQEASFCFQSGSTAVHVHRILRLRPRHKTAMCGRTNIKSKHIWTYEHALENKHGGRETALHTMNVATCSSACIRSVVISVFLVGVLALYVSLFCLGIEKSMCCPPTSGVYFSNSSRQFLASPLFITCEPIFAK